MFITKFTRGDTFFCIKDSVIENVKARLKCGAFQLAVVENNKPQSGP